MRYFCLPACDLDSETLGVWDQLHRSNAEYQSPFLSPWFTRSVAEVRNDVFVTVLEDGQRPVGFFPFQRMGKRAVPVAGILNDCHGVVVHADVEWAPTDMMRESRLSLWDFDHLIANNSEVRPFARSIIESPVISLAHGFESYFKERKRAGSQQLIQLRRKFRKLMRERDCVRFDVVSQDASAMERMIAWKIEQCESSGTPVFFREAWALELVDRLLRLDAPGCTGALSVLWVGDNVAAVHFGIRSETMWHWWFPGYSKALSAYSPGKLLLLKLCEHVAAADVSQQGIDLGAGDDAYKVSFQNDTYRLMQGHVSLGSPYAAIRSLKESAIARSKTSKALAPVRRVKRILSGRG